MLKLQEMICPSCNGKIDMKIENDVKSVFCPYCGTQFFVDDGKRETTINKNININKKYTNESSIKIAELEDQRDKRSWIAIFAIFILLFAIIGFVLLGLNLSEKKAVAEGKIQAGYYADLIGEDYKTVEAHFKAAGFTNIELIDLEDSGVAFWENGKVETISVGGDTSFGDADWFEPDTTVVIAYH